MMPERLARALETLRGRTIVVVGDLVLDEYVWGDVDRISPEAPVQIVDVARRSRGPGGAANVAQNLAAAGADVRLVGVAGDDAAGEALLDVVSIHGLDPGGILRIPGRPTTTKTRIVARGQQLVRLDDERRTPIEGEHARRLVAAVEERLAASDGLLLSDYAKGVLARGVVSSIVAAASARAPGRPVVVDPKSSDFSIYGGCTAITPNRREAELAAGLALELELHHEEAARRIRAVCGAEHVLITLGPQGMSLCSSGRPIVRIPSRAREVFDVTGAGDTAVAYFGLALASDLEARTAAEIANLAAGVKVGKLGACAVAPAELTSDAEAAASQPKIVDAARAAALCDHWRSIGRSVAFTNGCFDLLHAGHIRLLEGARKFGDALVVAINSDASVRRLKGSGRPVVPESDRAKILAALDAVDAVVVFDEDTPLSLIERLRPNVLVKGGDYTEDAIVGADLVRAAGGRVATIPLLGGLSTTALLESIRKSESTR